MEADTIKETEMKEKSTSKTRKLKTKLCSRNFIKGMYIWSVPLCKKLWTILKMDKGETQIWKMMTMYKALYLKYDKEKLYVPRKGRRGFASIEDSIDVSIKELEDYIKKSIERLITAAINNNVNTRTNRKTAGSRKQK